MCTCVIMQVCPCVTGSFTEHDVLIPRYPFFIPFFCPSSTPLFGEHMFLSWTFALILPSGLSSAVTLCGCIFSVLSGILRVLWGDWIPPFEETADHQLRCLLWGEGFITPSLTST